jgi:hypothetical protein
MRRSMTTVRLDRRCRNFPDDREPGSREPPVVVRREPKPRPIYRRSPFSPHKRSSLHSSFARACDPSDSLRVK